MNSAADIQERKPIKLPHEGHQGNKSFLCGASSVVCQTMPRCSSKCSHRMRRSRARTLESLRSPPTTRRLCRVEAIGCPDLARPGVLASGGGKHAQCALGFDPQRVWHLASARSSTQRTRGEMREFISEDCSTSHHGQVEWERLDAKQVTGRSAEEFPGGRGNRRCPLPQSERRSKLNGNM